jgi:hypothetical protein
VFQGLSQSRPALHLRMKRLVTQVSTRILRFFSDASQL